MRFLQTNNTQDKVIPPMHLYSETGLAQPLLQAIAEMGYETMTPIQEKAIPIVVQGRDVMASAQTGTGKTAAFALPLLQRMLAYQNTSTSPARHPVRALVLLPTRELADQVAQQIKLFAKHTQLRTAVVFGGMDMKPQAAQLKAGVEILVATPGRLLDHIEAKNCALNQVEYVVLDEADRMLDIGFLPDLQRILNFLPQQRTTLLFSATFSPEIKKLASSYLRNPEIIEVARPNETAATIEQRFYAVGQENKHHALVHILRSRKVGQAFVFCNSKLGCSRLSRTLEREGWAAVALHGDKTQEERLKALEAFKGGQVQLLVATDVAARGLDIKDVPAVFNYDIPYNAEDYVHRIGRTGRAGAAGLAINLVSPAEQRLVDEVERLIKTKIEIEHLDIPSARGAQSFASLESRLRSHEDGAQSTMDVEGGQGARGRYPKDAKREDTRSPRGPRRPIPLDPFFSQPYQEKPLEESLVRAQSKVQHKVSANIKSKRKVAILLRANNHQENPLSLS